VEELMLLPNLIPQSARPAPATGTTKLRYNPRRSAVGHTLHRVIVPPLTSFLVHEDQAQFEIALRAVFGSFSGRRAAKLLGYSRIALWNYATGKRRIPRHLWRRLYDNWSEFERYRKAEIAAREREFDAIIEQELALLVHARKLIGLANMELDAKSGMNQPDSPLLSARIRHRHRRREMLLREPQAALALSILFPKPSAGAER
jgi:hypothetical protein